MSLYVVLSITCHLDTLSCCWDIVYSVMFLGGSCSTVFALCGWWSGTIMFDFSNSLLGLQYPEKVGSLWTRVLGVFLPAGYPHSVTEDYMKFKTLHCHKGGPTNDVLARYQIYVSNPNDGVHRRVFMRSRIHCKPSQVPLPVCYHHERCCKVTLPYLPRISSWGMRSHGGRYADGYVRSGRW